MKTKPTRITERLTTTKLIDVVAAELGVTPKEAHETVTVVFDVIARAAASGHDVAVTNFGTWVSYRTKSRKTRNPQTGEPFTSRPFQKVRFRVSPHLAGAVRRRDRKVTIRKAPRGGRTASE